jgi:hypothetical protein
VGGFLELVVLEGLAGGEASGGGVVHLAYCCVDLQTGSGGGEGRLDREPAVQGRFCGTSVTLGMADNSRTPISAYHQGHLGGVRFVLGGRCFV